jgi:ProP effector
MSGRAKMAARNTIATLAELFPACFFLGRYRKPLKVGIHDEVLAALAGSGRRSALAGATAKQVGLALKIYASNGGYLRCIREGAERVGLGGEVTGHVEAATSATRQAAYRQPAYEGQAAIKIEYKKARFGDLKAAARARQERAAG